MLALHLTGLSLAVSVNPRQLDFFLDSIPSERYMKQKDRAPLSLLGGTSSASLVGGNSGALALPAASGSAAAAAAAEEGQWQRGGSSSGGTFSSRGSLDPSSSGSSSRGASPVGGAPQGASSPVCALMGGPSDTPIGSSGAPIATGPPIGGPLHRGAPHIGGPLEEGPPGINEEDLLATEDYGLLVMTRSVVRISGCISMLHVDHFVRGDIPVILKNTASKYGRESEEFLEVEVVRALVDPRQAPTYELLQVRLSPFSANIELLVIEQLISIYEKEIEMLHKFAVAAPQVNIFIYIYIYVCI